jgi:hypothetical protein
MKQAGILGMVLLVALAIAGPILLIKRQLDSERKLTNDFRAELVILRNDLDKAEKNAEAIGIIEFKAGVICGEIAFVKWAKANPGAPAGDFQSQELLKLAAEVRAEKFPNLPPLPPPR